MDTDNRWLTGPAPVAPVREGEEQEDGIEIGYVETQPMPEM